MARTGERVESGARPRDDDRAASFHQASAPMASGGAEPVAAWWVDVSNAEDLEANPLRWSDEVYRIFGYEPREVESSNALFFSHVHPDDRARVRHHLRRAIAERHPYSVEHRIVRRDGSEATVLERGDARYDARGRLLSLHGTVQYMTPQVRALEALRLSEETARRRLAEIEAIYANAPIGLCILDRELRWIRLNQALADMNGLPIEAHLGRTPGEVTPDMGRQAEAALRRMVETGEPLLEFEMSGTTPAQPGVSRSWRERWAPIRRADGEIIGISVAVKEITEQKRTAERMAALARFPEENPNPVMRLSADLTVLYANEAARTSALAVAPGRAPPPPLADVVRRALSEGARVDAEAPFGTRILSVTAVPVGTEVNVYARDVTALREAEQALREANERKDEFLATLSHELRNPLAPLRNSAWVLEHAEPHSEQAHRARAVVERQAEQLTCLVDDLLDLTRIASGKVELHRSIVDLRELVSRVADDFGLLLQDRGVALRTTLPEGSLWADGDAARLAQVVVNLMNNAAKFTRRGDEVALCLEALPDRARIRVRDTGLGIDPELLPHVFERFSQGSRTRAMSEGGLGLGLALVKGITQLHGGSVRVESAGRDRGAEFTVELPIARAAAAQPAPTAVAARAAASRRVLVVDDSVDGADSLADLLRLFGHEVQVAHDGPTAIACARADAPDVVVCDIGLPGMTGYDVAKALRASGFATTRLVALSGYAQPEDVRKALDAGFDAHLAKPPRVEDLERFLA